ncbi:DUF2264 domain-containing protein [Bailinhaonella thermotolerans]|uniref:DUF2264 domain-containing protein n=1 Tax=Bailinhaonella thermotolerans TaxID=1070861 RepID=UPI001F5BB152|nr:DUF2264 domain-containing protein [Bailinhaonella thermotolerans]
MIPLPPEDRSLSPHTGWTRAHWEAVADGLLAAVGPYRSPDGALIRLPGRASRSGCDALEGYARTFLLAAFRVAGGGPPALLTPYAEGLAAGPDVWEPIADRSQPMVEAASIALGLWLTRERLWDALPDRDRERVAGYLAGALRHEPVDNNWHLFPVMVGGFLAAAGFETAAAGAAVERGLARIEDWYAGDGWYRDGDVPSFDHYNGWAMHLYPVLYHLLSGSPPGEHGERLREFLRGYALTFGADGGMLCHGRSLTYRFASAAPLFAGALAGVTPLTPGQTRRAASGVLRYFLDRGALSAGGLLTLGYLGPHEPTLQPYSGSASPYWASKAFLGLLLPPDHPVWTDPEEPGPEGAAALPGPGLVVTNAGGVGRLLNHGSRHHPGDPLYDRVSYSTRTGPTGGEDTADNHCGVLGEDGSVTARGEFRPLGAGVLGDAAWAASENGHLRSLSVTRGRVEVHAHVAAPGSRLRATGWALPDATATVGGASVTVRAPGGLTSALTRLHGHAEPSAEPAPAGTAFGSRASVPALTFTAETGRIVYASVLTDGPAPDLPLVEFTGDLVLTWPDATRTVFAADLTPLPAP